MLAEAAHWLATELLKTHPHILSGMTKYEWTAQPRLVTAVQMREADRQAEMSGVSLHGLMLAAGHAVAHEAVNHYPHVGEWHILVGPGNNGGDGWVAALELLKAGHSACVWELNPASEPPAPAARARAAFLREAQASPLRARELLATLEQPESATRGVIDALFGNGLSRPIDGDLLEAVTGLNALDLPVVSVDVPSGMNPDLARTEHVYLQADVTVALAALKPAHVFEPARSACGHIAFADIGFPKEVLSNCSSAVLLQPEIIAATIPKLDPAGHKYDAGTVCLVAGSARYRGAAELAARAAWRSGAGLVTLVSDSAYSSAWPETIFEQHETGNPWPPAGLSQKRAAALLIGPGLELTALGQLGDMLEWAPGPVVLDATALDPGVMGAVRELFTDRPVVLTPHHGEAERLLAQFLPGEQGLTVSNPLAAAQLLSRELAAVVVLKGPATVVASPAGEIAVSTHGHPAMATGGTGDVLAGIITAVLARTSGNYGLFERVCAAVVVHGLAGEQAAREFGDGLIASDLISALPAVLSR